EEEWLTNYLKTFANISEVVWIGLKWSGKGFVWVDNTALDYKSWGKDAILDGSLLCGDFSISPLTMGNWTDNSCNKKGLIACQSPQMSLKTELATIKQQVIPLGFLYRQLPNTSAPGLLWPAMKWDDVTAQYAGLFFRAEGGTAATFELPEGWSEDLSPGRGYLDFYLHTTTGESRPRYYHDATQHAVRKYGRVYGTYSLHNKGITINDPTLIRDILAKDFHIFADKPIYTGAAKIYKTIALISANDQWRHIRSIMSPAFSSGRLNAMMSHISDISDRLVDNLEKYKKSETFKWHF
ncbi:unnamed protein product, partial [Oppiella nova]